MSSPKGAEDQSECFEECYNGPAIWPCKFKSGCQYRLCQTKCLAEYMECEAQNAAQRTVTFCSTNPKICLVLVMVAIGVFIIVPKPCPV